MTTLVSAPPSRPFAAASGRFPAHNAGLLRAGLIMMLLILPFGLLMAADPRAVAGFSAWLKPMKFALSLGLHLLTLAVLWPWLSAGTRGGFRGVAMASLLIGPSFFEITYIAAQAAAGQDSHFNLATPYTRLMFALMGVFAVILTVTTSAVGIGVLKAGDGTQDPAARAIRRAIGLGLLLSGLLGLASGVAISVNGGHTVGTQTDPAAIVPLFNWSRQVGDLRIGHFIGLHAAQILPLCGWMAVRTLPARASALVTLAALLVTAATALALGLALAGRPLV